MKLSDIREMPTAIEHVSEDKNRRAYHESLTRSYHTLEKVREMCHAKVPHSFILEVIEDLTDSPSPNV